MGSGPMVSSGGGVSFPVMKAAARGLTVVEAARHAQVSIANRHRCRGCFTCACVEVLEDALRPAVD